MNLYALIEILRQKFFKSTAFSFAFIFRIFLKKCLLYFDEQPEVEDRSICYDIAFNPGEQLISLSYTHISKKRGIQSTSLMGLE